MALPKLNDQPNYEIVIPSTGKTVSYRPFLVKEQKVLLIALESQDEKQILKAIVNTINVCVVDKINCDLLTTFDIEYMFTQIRARSAGETAKVGLDCPECEEKNEVEIDLDAIKMVVNHKAKSIQLNDQYTLIMKFPQYAAMMLNIESSEEETLTAAVFEMIIMCLDELRTEEEIIKFSDETREEIEQFLDGLTGGQLNLIMEFVNNIPKLEHDIEFTCSSCNKENTMTLQGMQDFF